MGKNDRGMEKRWALGGRRMKKKQELHREGGIGEEWRTDKKQIADVRIGRKDYEAMMWDVRWMPDIAGAMLIREGRSSSRARRRLPRQNACDPCKREERDMRPQ